MREHAVSRLAMLDGPGAEPPAVTAAWECEGYYDRMRLRAQLWQKDVAEIRWRAEEIEEFLSPGDDPWGNPYYVEAFRAGGFQVISRGPDGRKGTEDDIVFPRETRK